MIVKQINSACPLTSLCVRNIRVRLLDRLMRVRSLSSPLLDGPSYISERKAATSEIDPRPAAPLCIYSILINLLAHSRAVETNYVCNSGLNNAGFSSSLSTAMIKWFVMTTMRDQSNYPHEVVPL